jgi:hypothetical protein
MDDVVALATALNDVEDIVTFNDISMFPKKADIFILFILLCVILSKVK